MRSPWVGAVSIRSSCDPEVDDLDRAVKSNEDVRWADVPVNDRARFVRCAIEIGVCVVKALGHRDGDSDGDTRFERSGFFGPDVQEIAKVSPFESIRA